MGQQDLYQSDFYDDKNRFADIFNGVLFDGKEVMKPEELETEDSVMVGHRETKGSKKVICDKVCKWKGKYVSVMVLENQSYVDYRMVLRVMESEVIGYDRQRQEMNRRNLKAGIKLVGDEYLSKMKKGQKFVPIITLVLYLGKKKLWDGARSLYEMLEIDEAVKPFVNDFKLNLFDYHEWNDFSRFKTENRLLFEALSCGSNAKRMKETLRRNPKFGRLDLESAKAIAGILKVKIDLDLIKMEDEEGKKVYDMCKAFDDYKEEGRLEGRREGRREGRLEGRREGRREGERKGRLEGEIQALTTVVKNLMNNQKVTFEVAAEVLVDCKIIN